MLWERRGLIETRLHAKVLSIRPVYALFHANGQHLNIEDFGKLMLITSADHCVYNQQFCTGFSNRINVL